VVGERGAVTLAAAILAAVLALLGLHPSPDVAEAIAAAHALHGCDAALVTAVCAHESQLGTVRVRHLLCGAHLRFASLGPREWDRSVGAQVGAVCAAFPRGSQRTWLRRLASWRCGGSRTSQACRETVGARYAVTVATLREQIAARLHTAR